MKKQCLFLFVILTAASSFFGNVFASPRIQVNEKGEIRQVEEVQTWRERTEEEKRAMENPGEEIPYGPVEEKMGRNFLEDFFHITITKTKEKVVVFVFGKEGGFVYLDKQTQKSEKKFAWHVIFLFMSAFLMGGDAFYRSYRRIKWGSVYVTTSLALLSVIAVIAAIIAIATAPAPAMVFYAVAAIASLLSSTAVTSSHNDIIAYKFLLAIYYIDVVVAIFI